jgi:N-acyl-D-amino-acid deacylase
MVMTDGIYVGDYPNPRGWGTYPRILGQYVREKGWLRLEDAIRRMTGFPAMRFGLDDRGLLRKGMAADLVIFDPQTVRDRATFEEPRLSPVGMEHVVVNGVPVLEHGVLAADRPGRMLRMRGT